MIIIGLSGNALPTQMDRKMIFYIVFFSQISIFPNEGFCSESSSFPPTFLQKLWPFNNLFCSKSSIILSVVGMDILGTIYKSCALKYQVEGNRINKKIKCFHKNGDKVLCYFFDPCNIICYGK